MRRAFAISVSVVLLAAGPVNRGGGSLSGYVFGDFYYVSQHHDPAIDGMNGVWFRRIYFTYDQKTSPRASIRVRLEMNSPGDFRTAESMKPSVKDAYLRYTAGQTTYLLGLIPTPTLAMVEDLLGYRPYEKTPLDLWRMGHSRDFGLGVKLRVGATKIFGVVGNGSHTKSETDRGKAVYLSLEHALSRAWTLGLYADINDRSNASDRRTFQVFLAYRGPRAKAGLLYAYQDRKGEEDLSIFSLYAESRFAERARVFARADWLDNPVPDADKISYFVLANNARPTFYHFGLVYEVTKDFYLAPNVEWVTYAQPSGGGPAPDDAIFLKATFFYRWR